MENKGYAASLCGVLEGGGVVQESCYLACVHGGWLVFSALRGCMGLCMVWGVRFASSPGQT